MLYWLTVVQVNLLGEWKSSSLRFSVHSQVCYARSYWLKWRRTISMHRVNICRDYFGPSLVLLQKSSNKITFVLLSLRTFRNHKRCEHCKIITDGVDSFGRSLQFCLKTNCIQISHAVAAPGIFF